MQIYNQNASVIDGHLWYFIGSFIALSERRVL